MCEENATQKRVRGRVLQEERMGVYFILELVRANAVDD